MKVVDVQGFILIIKNQIKKEGVDFSYVFS